MLGSIVGEEDPSKMFTTVHHYTMVFTTVLGRSVKTLQINGSCSGTVETLHWNFSFVDGILSHELSFDQGSWREFCTDMEFLKSVLGRNSYPLGLVNACIRKFMNRQFDVMPRTTPVSVPKLPAVLVLPFLGSNSLRIRSVLLKLFSQYLPQVQLRIVFKSTRRVASCFPFKDRFPMRL